MSLSSLRASRHGALTSSGLLLFILGFAAPGAAQEGPESWVAGLHGGPFVGLSTTRVSGPEYGARIGARRGAWAVDVTGSALNVSFAVPPATHRAYEALAGFAWYPAVNPYVPGVGFRAGVADTPNAFGDRGRALVLGPHTAIGVPVGGVISLRGEAGGLVYVSGLGPGGPRGYVRVGIEVGRR